MAERPVEATIKSEKDKIPSEKNDTLEKIEEKITESRAQLKARLAHVLERGIVQSRLQVDLPPEVHGEWVRNDPLEINRMKTLGFDIDREYATKRALHNDGSDSAIVGDVIFMTCPKLHKELIDEIRDEEFRRMNSPKSQREDEEYKRNAEALKTAHIQPIVTSEAREARKENIREALAAVGEQTKTT